ncbi:MAG: indolepyruvate oxidoreductase subunit beta family protein [Lautropia sp.]
MNALQERASPGAAAASPVRSIHVAVMALGGQGGGVLVDWIVDLAEHAGWTAQATSVAGVAQRTGATIYYVELVEPTPGHEPVMALMPVPGDVDVVIAAELMEAGRAVERGFVTPGRTVVVASSHRTYAIQEKMTPGDGIADGAAVLELVRQRSRQLVIDDMQALAQRHGSVISASLFGALAGSGALPFPTDAFEAVVERSGIGVAASIAALRAAAGLARSPSSARSASPQSSSAQVSSTPPSPPGGARETAPRPLPERAATPALQPLVERIRTEFPLPARDWLGEGLARVVDFQDARYGSEYLDRVARISARDDGSQGHALSIEAARWIAVAMSYDDLIRVADLKTRPSRGLRVRAEIGAAPADVVGVEEYFHPRLEEAMGALPVRLADRLDASPRLKARLARLLDRGRRIHTHTVRGHLQLRLVAGLRRWRRGNRRHAEETAHIDAWLAGVERALAVDPALAIELLRCRRLVKGYSDTHARGTSRFDRLVAMGLERLGSPDAAATIAARRAALLRDAEAMP